MRAGTSTRRSRQLTILRSPTSEGTVIMCTRTVVCMLVVYLASAAASPAAGQSAASGKWEIEFHGGGVFPTTPAGGTVSLPAQGELFTSVTNVPALGPAVHASRRQSSWYFGDGAILFNGLAETLVGTGQAQFSGRIATLDPVLGRSLGTERRRREHRGPRQPRADATAHRRTERRLQPGAASDHAGKQRLDRSDAVEFHPGLQRVVGAQWTCDQREPRAEQRHIHRCARTAEAAISSRRAVRSSSI